MCGIVAVAGRDAVAAALEGNGGGTTIWKSPFQRSLDALAHRGPDGAGTFLAGNRAVVLGHTRLAVIGPPGGNQPINNESDTITAVVNGEIYGFEAHARWLVARGHMLHTRCDSEVLVHLYEELGDDVVRAVGGELAFVLWDSRRQRLLAGRDRFGVKPLVWTRWRDGIALASEAKALFALGVPARWDDEAWFHAAHVQYPQPDRTLFAGIHVLEPGSVLAWERDEVRIARYWDPPAVSTIATLDEAAASLRAALDASVRDRLRADARICVQLSGGLDSSSVAALAVRHGGLAAAFTVGFTGGGAYDERGHAAATAHAVGIPLNVVDVTADAIATQWPEAVAHGEGLAINGHLVGKWMLSRAMRDAGFKVALTGEGADELLAGYPHLRRDAGVVIEGHAVSRGVMLPSGTGLATDGVQARLGYVPTWIAAKAGLGARVRSLLAPDLVRAYAKTDPFGALIDQLDAARLAAMPRLHASATTWRRTALAQYILKTLGDGMEMAHGIEGRVPFLDHRVAEVALSIDPAVLAGDAIDKPVLRRAMDGIVPPAVLARAKHPFLAPPLSRIAPALVQDTLRAHARRSPLVDGDALVRVLDALPAMSDADQQAWDPALMLVLSAAILEAKYCR